MSKANEIRKKFGGSGDENTAELKQIYDEIERIADKCKSLIWHEQISHNAMKELKKEGFSVGFENNCYIITW
ncbi:MAG: hypothetical protein RIR01_1947 [Bacteroidota bacterium]|jgi:uncharacterized protein CbrC (UPF0167 family)